MATYKQTTNTVPTFGEQNSSVLALQQKLKSFGAPIATDSKYGPETQKYAKQYAAQLNPTPAPTTPAVTTSAAPIYVETASEKALRIATEKAAKDAETAANTTINEDQIRADALAQMQGEINAQNAIYANKIAEEKLAGSGRLGSEGAIQARRGLLGSDFGAASTANVNTANASIVKGIEDERAAVVSSLMNKGRDMGAAMIKEKNAARKAGVEEYLKYLGGSVDAAKTRAKTIAATILNGKLDFTKDLSAIEQAAKDAGVTVEQIKNAYTDVKQEKDKADAEIIKAGKTTQPQSVQEYEYAKANGYTGSYNEYQTLDTNRKAKIAGAGTGGLTPYQQFQAQQSISKDNQKRTENAREMARQASLIESSYNNIQNGGDPSLNTQAIITSFNKILDPTSVVRESEYDRTSAGQSLIARLEGKVRNIAEGGAGVTPETLKEASEIAKTYLAESKKSIDAENKRAESMANFYGINPSFVSNTYQGGTSSNITTAPDGTLIEITD